MITGFRGHLTQFSTSLEGNPLQIDSSLTALNISYRTIVEQKALRQLREHNTQLPSALQ